MMTDTCLMLATRAPNATTLTATIKSYCDTAARPDKRLAEKNRTLAGRACARHEARPDDGAARAQVIRSLGALGMDTVSASTFVDMTEQLFAAN